MQLFAVKSLLPQHDVTLLPNNNKNYAKYVSINRWEGVCESKLNGIFYAHSSICVYNLCYKYIKRFETKPNAAYIVQTQQKSQ